MHNVLITGAAGLLGSNLSYLLRNKANIVAFDRNNVDINNVQFVYGSVLDVSVIEQIINGYDIDVIIHCAAITNMDLCEQNPNYAEAINSTMAGNIAYIADKHDVKVVYISSDAVYPGTKQGLYSETDPVAPISVYGKTKLMGEEATLRYGNNLVIRTNMYGYNYRNKDSFGEWVLNTLNKGETLKLFYDLNFSPVLVNQLVNIIWQCVEAKISGIYNVCCTGSISKYELGCAIKSCFALPGKIMKSSMKEHQYIAPRTQNMGMDNTKIIKTLGIKIPSPYEDVELFKQLYDSGYPKLLKEGK